MVAAIFAAALSSKAAELNALGSTTTIDFYRHLIRREATDAHYVIASKCFTMFWGMVAIGFALFANLTENLIQAANIVASIFYGVVLGLFLVAFFLRRVGGTAVFWAAVAAQTLVLVIYFLGRDIGYLWYNVIGCSACVLLSLVLQAVLGGQSAHDEPRKISRTLMSAARHLLWPAAVRLLSAPLPVRENPDRAPVAARAGG